MVPIHLAAAGLVLTLSLGAARASDDRERTGSIDASPTVTADSARNAAGETASVILPEQSVTAPAPAFRPLPPLKPLPKWDPHVCIGC
ncbi:hypothetical protein [Methylobacterium sp. CM6257]